MSALRPPVALLLLLGVLLVAGGAAYLAYFATPHVADPPLVAGQPRATARRALLFVIDGFAAVPGVDPAEMPTFTRLAHEGASGVARTSPVSLTAPCVYSLATGRPGTLALGILDFHAPPTHIESLPSLVVAAGKRIALAGDPAWGRQFGWLAAPEDRLDSPEAGITLDPRVRVADRGAIEFLLPKLRDPRYGLVVAHLGTPDAVGHVVTPLADEYRDALRFVDAELTETMRHVDSETIVLVTGDHGMGPRGTHGGRDEEATLTPFVLWGPGVRSGATSDLPQTALPATIAALMGLPMPAASEHPPATELLALASPESHALEREFLARKLAAARSLAPELTLAPDADLHTANTRLNEILFASANRHLSARLATFALFLLAAAIALVLMRRTVPPSHPQPSLVGQLVGGLAGPVLFAAGATLVIDWRSSLPFKPDVLGALAAATLGLASLLVACGVYRSATLRARLGRMDLTVYFWTSILLVTPLLITGWFDPTRYFQLLAIVLVASGVVASRPPRERSPANVSGLMSTSLLAVSFYVPGIATEASDEWAYLVPGTLAVLALAAWSFRNLPLAWSRVATGVLVAAAAAAAAWKTNGGVASASAMLAVFAAGLACAVIIRRDPDAAAGLVIGVSTFLGLTMASDTRESLVFLAAGLAALGLSRIRFPLTPPSALYFAALAALALRISLYFALGDHYAVGSIRTAPGFRLADAGLALPLVIATLLLKYTIPWLLILGAALPSLAAGDAGLPRRAVYALALGYVARFMALAATADPFRLLPRGMEGLVGLFAISWAELLTFALASAVLLTLAPTGKGAALAPARAAPDSAY